MLRLFSLFDQYERASGAQLNVKKSHGLLFGTWSTRSHPTIPLNWSTEEITVLVCKLGPGVQPDWGHLLTKLEDLLALWKRRQLSFHGRALIVNVLGLSLFWYQATMFDVPKTIVARINKLIFPFIWNKIREWLARSSLTQPFADGGLGVVDVARKILSLRSAWLRRFLSNDVVYLWKSFFQYYLASAFPGRSVVDLLSSDSISAYRIKRLPPFYASVLRLWIHVRGCRLDSSWVVPRPPSAPLPVVELTPRHSFHLLAQSDLVAHRAFDKFACLGFSPDWSRVWSNLLLWRFVRSVQDTAWLSSHGVLPTADRLVRFRIHVDPPCFCGAPESLVHLFTSCPFAVDILAWFSQQFSRCKPGLVVSPQQVLFGFSSKLRVPVVFDALLGVLRHHIWLARNLRRFEHQSPSVAETLQKAKSTFRFMVRLESRHCPPDRFLQDWLAAGIIGSLTEER